MTQLQYFAFGSLDSLADPLRDSLFDRRAASGEVADAVASIIASVRCGGDSALRGLARKFDGVELGRLEVPRSAWRSALGSLDTRLRDALDHAAHNIGRAHAAFRPSACEIEVEPGVIIARVPRPLQRVGVYAPGGRAAYGSSVLMGVIPARVAGVDEVIVCSPPTESGWPAQLVLAACEVADATRVFAVGGAGAIAAMALGTASLPRVDCIVGPGGPYVTEAKLQLAREVRLDLTAGPSELLVLADNSADIDAVAAELCAQGEHGSDTALVAVLVGSGLLERLDAALAKHVALLLRKETVCAALNNHGALLETQTIGDAIDFADNYAAEHALVVTRDAAAVAARIRNAGSVLVGPSASVVFGDYVTGANHVLPTAGYARLQSGLSTETFLRWTTVQSITPEAAPRLARSASALAAAEGLSGHAMAARQAGGIEP
ncbi:MAG: histidinol dehydrogenase [Gemmatimonadaceae bacterium]